MSCHNHNKKKNNQSEPQTLNSTHVGSCTRPQAKNSPNHICNRNQLKPEEILSRPH